ncbi:MAG: DUF1492 domain-containing protein, partial [Clostridiales bacterium]|nr:DUF1492 domain-containing protein [Clostridiales bacterium]
IKGTDKYMTRNQAAGRLKSWGNYINIITGLQDDIIEIRKTMVYNRGLKAVKTDIIPNNSNVSKPMENIAVKNIDVYEEEISEIENQIKAVKKNKEDIDKFVDSLEDIEQRLLRFRYIRKKSWNAISMKIHLSDRQCYRVHNKILDKLTTYL